MKKLTIDNVDLKDKRVLVRVDFNVPLDSNQNITNDIRIRASLPTINKIINDGGKAILMSHLGRPKGQRKPEFSLKPAAVRLGKMLSTDVLFSDDCIGESVMNTVNSIKPGDVLLLENVRFHKGETKNDPDFANAINVWREFAKPWDMAMRGLDFIKKMSQNHGL